MFNKVTLRILNAELVRDPNLIMKMDPYAVVRTSRAETKTSVAPNGGKHPRWNESFNLDVTGDNSIYVAIFDQESVGKDNAIAEAFINLNQLQDTNGVIARSYPLTYKGKNAGELFVEIQCAGANANVNNQAFVGQSHQANLAQPNQQFNQGYGQQTQAPNSMATQISQTAVSTQPDYSTQQQMPHGHGTGFVAPVIGSSDMNTRGTQGYNAPMSNQGYNAPMGNQGYIAPMGNQGYVAAPLSSAAVYNDKAESRALNDQYKLDEKLAKEQFKASDAYLKEQHKASETYVKDQEKVNRTYAKEQEKIAESQSKIQTKYAKEREKSAERHAKMDQKLVKEHEKVNEGLAKLEHSREKEIAKNQQNLAKIDEKFEKDRLKQQERLGKVDTNYQKEQMKEAERLAKTEHELVKDQVKHSSGHIPVGGAYATPGFVGTTNQYPHSQEIKSASINNLSTGRPPTGHVSNIAPVGSAVLGSGPTGTTTEVSRTEIAMNPTSTTGFATGSNQAYAQPPVRANMASKEIDRQYQTTNTGYDASRINPNNVTIDPNMSKKLSRDNSHERSGQQFGNAQINFPQSTYGQGNVPQSGYGSTNYVAPIPNQMDMNVNPRVDYGVPPANLTAPTTIIDNRMDRSKERIGNQVRPANTNLDNRAYQEVHTQMANMNMSEHRLDRSGERQDAGMAQANYNLPPQNSTLQQSVPVNSQDAQASHNYHNLFGKAIIKIIRAELTRNTNLITKMDPYVLIRTKMVELRTHVAEGAGKSPVWNAIFDVELRGDSSLYIGVWDRDTFTADDIIADITFDLRGNMKEENRFVGFQPLYHRGNNVGRIFLELEFYPEASATNLPVTYGQDNTYMNINRDQFNNYVPAPGKI